MVRRSSLMQTDTAGEKVEKSPLTGRCHLPEMLELPQTRATAGGWNIPVRCLRARSRGDGDAQTRRPDQTAGSTVPHSLCPAGRAWGNRQPGNPEDGAVARRYVRR